MFDDLFEGGPGSPTETEKIFDGSPNIHQVILFMANILWAATNTSSLVFNMFTLFISALTIIGGPGMALRGPEGAVSVAVRFMEQQNKRALRFFGRGLVASLCAVAVSGLKAIGLKTYWKGSIILSLGLYGLYMLNAYGADISRKFHLSLACTVRATFSGSMESSNKLSDEEVERLEDQIALKKFRWWRHHGLPNGHHRFTTLTRLDKLITLPYHDRDRWRLYEKEVGMRSLLASGKANFDEQLNHLIQQEQSVPLQSGSRGSAGQSLYGDQTCVDKILELAALEGDQRARQEAESSSTGKMGWWDFLWGGGVPAPLLKSRKVDMLADSAAAKGCCDNAVRSTQSSHPQTPSSRSTVKFQDRESHARELVLNVEKQVQVDRERTAAQASSSQPDLTRAEEEV
uniref:Uncharacterized protein n=1 Tax=Coccolithus braarudii TaxID=221442 RepID=A0A7S0LNZ0_9EUKA